MAVERQYYNLRAETEMAMRFAIRQGWLSGLGSEEELLAAMSCETTDGKKEYSLKVTAKADSDWHPGTSLSIATSHTLETDEIKTEIVFFSDLVTRVGKQLYLQAALYLSPVWMGPRSKRPFELVLNVANFRFETDDGISFDFCFLGDDLVVSRNRGEKKVKTEELYCGGEWRRGGKQKLAQYFDPRVIEAPRIFWLKLLGRVLDGKLLGETAREALDRVSRELIEQTSLIKGVLGIG